MNTVLFRLHNPVGVERIPVTTTPWVAAEAATPGYVTYPLWGKYFELLTVIGSTTSH